MTSRLIQQRTCGLLFIALVGGFWYSCGQNVGTPPATGLSLGPAGLRLTLSVGCLNDRDFSPFAATEFRQLNKRVEALLARLPGLSVRLIPDQPMDAQFLMERTAPRSRERARTGSADRLLFLSSGADNETVAARYGRPAGLLERLARAQQLRARTGMPLVYDKLPASDFAWRLFLADQGRYDIIVTNAFMFPDELGGPSAQLDSLGGVRGRIGRTTGRRALEGWGGVLSINEELRPGGAGLDEGDLTLRLAGLVLALVVPLSWEEAGAAARRMAGGHEPFGDCRKCASAWEERLRVLHAYALIREGQTEAACRRPMGVSEAQSVPGKGLALLEPQRARDIQKNARAIAAVCAAKR